MKVNFQTIHQIYQIMFPIIYFIILWKWDHVNLALLICSITYIQNLWIKVVFLDHFHQSYFHKSLSGGKLVKTIWLSYSPILDKIYCTTCKLFGLSKIKKIKLLYPKDISYFFIR